MNRAMAKPTPDLLRKVSLFSGLEDKDLESLAEEFNERRFPPGHSVALEGEGGLVFFVVESGEAAVEVHGEEVGTLGPGDSFGEIALIDRRPRTATVTALSPMKCLVLSRGQFHNVIRQNALIAVSVLQTLGERLRTLLAGQAT